MKKHFRVISYYPIRMFVTSRRAEQVFHSLEMAKINITNSDKEITHQIVEEDCNCEIKFPGEEQALLEKLKCHV